MRASGWIIYESAEAERNEKYIERYFESANRHNVQLELLFSEKLNAGFRDGCPVICYDGREIKLPEFVINRTGDPLLSRHLEAMSLPVFNSGSVSEICLDKRRAMQEAVQACLPVMPSVFCRAGQSRPQWQELVDTIAGSAPGFSMTAEIAADGPAFVLKPIDGRGGKNVMLARSPAEYEQALKVFTDSQEIMIQKAASDLGKDLRVYMIGRSIVAAMLRTSDPSRDFRSNYCLGGEASAYDLSHKEKAMVKRLADRMDFGLVGVDLIFDHGEPVFNEIEDVVGSRMLYALTDIDIADRYLEYIIKTSEKKWTAGG